MILAKHCSYIVRLFLFLILVIAMVASAAIPAAPLPQQKEAEKPVANERAAQPAAFVAESKPPLRGPPRPVHSAKVPGAEAGAGAGETVVEVVIVKEIVTLPTAAAIRPSSAAAKPPAASARPPAKSTAAKPPPPPKPSPSPSPKPANRTTPVKSSTTRTTAPRTTSSRTTSVRTTSAKTSAPRTSTIQRTSTTKEDEEEGTTSKRAQRSSISRKSRSVPSRRGRRFKPFNVNQYNTAKPSRFEINNIDMLRKGMGNDSSSSLHRLSQASIVTVLLCIPVLLFMI